MCTNYQLVDNISQQDSVAANGFERVSFIQIKYQLIERKLPVLEGSQLPNSSRKALVDGIIDVYTQVYGYLIRLVLHFARSKMGRAMRDAIKHYDWKELLASLETKDRQIQDMFITLSNSNLMQDMSTLVEQQTQMSHDVQKMKETTAVGLALLYSSTTRTISLRMMLTAGHISSHCRLPVTSAFCHLSLSPIRQYSTRRRYTSMGSASMEPK